MGSVSYTHLDVYKRQEILLSAQLTGLVNIDTEMSETSDNPVQNKAVKAYADGLAKYRIISEVTITEDIDTYTISQDSNGNTFDLRKLFFLFIGTVSYTHLDKRQPC